MLGWTWSRASCFRTAALGVWSLAMTMPKTPLLTTDCAMFDGRARVLLIRRKNEPFKGDYALPGGFVDIGETTEASCRREVLEEAGIVVDRLHLVGVYSDLRAIRAVMPSVSPI